MLVLGVSWLILAPLCLWLLLRGNGATRLGSVVALAGLEAATIWVNGTARVAPVPVARTPVVSAPAVAAAGSTTSCTSRLPAPERALLDRRQGALRAVTLFWTAAARECDHATVVLRRERRGVKVWLHEGPMRHRPADARTLPVSVAGGTASVQVPVAPPLPGKGGFGAIDGRTGRPIASP
ncbi:hypothetical protein [Streptosporangium canum]|uniref:hypothetical protein n=1 Tax=Streptosporangium canum TaxID=324952 RepID=UPI0037948406